MIILGRPKGTSNIMRTAEEKEKILNEHFINFKSLKQISEEYNVDLSLLKRWRKKYQKDGINGLVSNTGKHDSPIRGKYNRNPSEIDKLKYELLQKEIELMRLKKGYQVKGVGHQKEYVTTFDVNTK